MTITVCSRTAAAKTLSCQLNALHNATKYFKELFKQYSPYRCKQLLDDIREMRRYWRTKREPLDRTPWRLCFGRGYWAAVRETT